MVSCFGGFICAGMRGIRRSGHGVPLAIMAEVSQEVIRQNDQQQVAQQHEMGQKVRLPATGAGRVSNASVQFLGTKPLRRSYAEHRL
jgi:hypothetical protein